MRVLVIGGTRFIGPHVVQRLVDDGHEVTVFNRGRTEQTKLPETVRRINGDRGCLADFTDEFRRLSPEVVVDMVPMNERDGRLLVSVFRGLARRVVALSSIDVYRAYDIVRGLAPGPADRVPLTEDSPLRQRFYPYEREGTEEYEKILVEKAVMDEPDLPATVLRLPAVYGPGDFQHRMYRFVKRMADERPEILLGEGYARWRFTHGYVEDVAVAVALAATNDPTTSRVYNVGEADAPTWAERLFDLGDAFGWSGDLITAPEADLPEHLKTNLNPEQHWVADTSRIRQELRYEETVPKDQALRRTISWELTHPPEQIDPEQFDYAAEDAVLARLR